MPGIPLLFTDSAGTPDLFFEPFPGLFPDDELFPGEDLFPDDGPTLDFYAVAPLVGSFGVTLDVDPVAVTFDGGEIVFEGLGEVNLAVDPVAVTFSGGDAELSGLPLVLAVDPAPVVFSGSDVATSGGMLIILVPSVRELPPLRLSHLVETPSGRFFRWGEDEPNPANVPSAVRFSDTMPGGFETGDATLPRKVGADAPDLEPLSTWTIYGAGGEVAWQGRIERAPRTSGDQVSVSPSAVGWQAHLDDDKSARMIYVDQDLTKWGPMSAPRGSALSGFGASDGSSATNETSGRPELWTSFSGAWSPGGLPLSEAWYDAGPGVGINIVYYAWRNAKNVNTADTNWFWQVLLSSDELATAVGPSLDVSGNLRAAGPSVGGLSPTPGATRRYAAVQHFYTAGPAGGDNVEYAIAWTVLGVYGNHGRPLYGPQTTTQAPGMLASDIVAHSVIRWAPQLKASEGPSGSVRPSGFVVPQMAFPEPTSAGEIVKAASRFGLQDWAVWDNKTFWWHDRGAHGRKWRTRVGPAQLEETGPQVDRVWNSVMVQYQDVGGSTRVVGPPGSGANTEDPVLNDLDLENPANRAGIVRRALLTMGTSTPAGAIEIGRRFLEEQKLLDRSGRARLVGHVESDRGVLHPYWAVRAGDQITFVDSNDVSYRRVVRTEKDHASRTCSVDLDAPPDSLQALLERLGVGIVDLGFG